MKDLIKKVRPNRFTDIGALVALFRPGPMQLADDFIKRKHGIEEVDYEKLNPIEGFKLPDSGQFRETTWVHGEDADYTRFHGLIGWGW